MTRCAASSAVVGGPSRSRRMLYEKLHVGGNYAKVAEGRGLASRRVDKGAVDVVNGGALFLLEFVVKEGQEFSRY